MKIKNVSTICLTSVPPQTIFRVEGDLESFTFGDILETLEVPGKEFIVMDKGVESCCYTLRPVNHQFFLYEGMTLRRIGSIKVSKEEEINIRNTMRNTVAENTSVISKEKELSILISDPSNSRPVKEILNSLKEYNYSEIKHILDTVNSQLNEKLYIK